MRLFNKKGESRTYICNAIEGIKFFRLDAYDCSKILAMLAEQDKYGLAPKLLNSFVLLYRAIFFDITKFETVDSKGDKKTLFAFCEHVGNRWDYYDMFYRIYTCSSNSTFVKWEDKWKPDSINKVIGSLWVLGGWFIQLLGSGLSLLQKFAVMAELIVPYKLVGKIKEFENFDNFVVVYDAKPSNSLLCQYFNLQNKTTITAQHGLMMSPSDIPFGGFGLMNSVAKYFMAWDRITYDEGIKTGLSPEKMVICGNCRCIDLRESTSPHNRIFGVLLDGIDSINIKMIELANEIARRTNYQYILRYHPNYKGDEYIKMVDSNYYAGVTSTILADYANAVEYTLMANSAALLELIYMKHPTYVFSTDSEREFYRYYIPVCRTLDDFFNLRDSEEYMPLMFKSLITVENVRESYVSFFKQIENRIK